MMKNRPEMQMSHCDDEDESASSGARHKGQFGLIRSWARRGGVGGQGGGVDELCVVRLRPAC